MRRQLVRTNAFIRAAKRFLKRHPDKIDLISVTLTLMEENVFDPRLRTHKLKGDLSGAWASSGGYDVRIVFRFVTAPEPESIALLSIGTHDEVY
jgi:mRNA-degrading endonuclease YafQ of YafQ-DinJ toxin-antitoxin module